MVVLKAGGWSRLMRDKLRNGEMCGSTGRRERIENLRRGTVSKLPGYLVDWGRSRTTVQGLEGIAMKKGTIRRRGKPGVIGQWRAGQETLVGGNEGSGPPKAPH